MSPRGVYDRKNKKGAKAEKQDVPKVSTNSVAALPTPNNVLERFAILRDNIQTLANVRFGMVPSDVVAKKTEAELIETVSALTDLRRRVFGLTDDEDRAQKTSQFPQVVQNGEGVHVPLPTQLAPS